MRNSLISCIYLQQDFSQRANHVKGSIFFPGVTCRINKNLVAEPHCLLQHLNTRRLMLLDYVKNKLLWHLNACLATQRSLRFKEINRTFNLASFLLLQEVKRRVCAAVVGEMKSSNTSGGSNKQKLVTRSKFLFG